MKTKILKPNQIEQAVNFLKNGEIVAVPTETVYGLAADASNEEAVSKIFLAKKRPADHPLIVHIDCFEKLIHWAEHIPDNAIKIASHFGPGPLTLILQKKKNVTHLITGGLETIALRIPRHPIALQIIKKLGTAMAAPSANPHKKTSPTKSEHVLKNLSGKIAAIVEGGQCSIGLESTIIDMTTTLPRIVRPGAITAVMINKAVGIEIEEQPYHYEKVPGNMKIHYQPEKPLFLLSIEEIKKKIFQEKNIAIVHYTCITQNENATYYKMPKNSVEYARILYDILHRIDNTQVNEIWIEKPPCISEWLYINDRLQKAYSKVPFPNRIS